MEDCPVVPVRAFGLCLALCSTGTQELERIWIGEQLHFSLNGTCRYLWTTVLLKAGPV